MKRLTFFLVVLMLVMWVHPLVGLFCAVIIGVQSSYNYYELIIFGMLVDVLYKSIYSLGSIQIPVYTLITALIFISLSSIKKRLSFHA